MTIAASCPKCGAKVPKRRMFWTEHRIIQAVQNWTRLHGRIPTLSDWTMATVDHPSQKTVRERFGTWNEAILAAGYQPHRPRRAA